MKAAIPFLLSALAFFASGSMNGAKSFAASDGRMVAVQRLTLGRFQSRAIFRPAKGSRTSARAPLIILIPGSGPNGPEEMMPPRATRDGRPAPLFNQIASSLSAGGFHTLALGKPGVDFARTTRRTLYDEELYKNLTWADLIANVEDAVRYVRSRSDVDSNRIWLLGHSEGTAVAVDVANRSNQIAGLLLLGYGGEDMKTRLEWQLFEREIELFLRPIVDLDRDGRISRDEDRRSPEFTWDWSSGRSYVAIADVALFLRRQRQSVYDAYERSPLYRDIFNRGPIHDLTASLTIPVYVFTGEADVRTPAFESKRLAHACRARRKRDCIVRLMPGLGHGFSSPRPPRAHALLDETLGPISPDFAQLLGQWARHATRLR